VEKIATYLPGRSHYHIKNIWYHHHKKKIRDKKDEVKSTKFYSNHDEKIPENLFVEKIFKKECVLCDERPDRKEVSGCFFCENDNLSKGD